MGANNADFHAGVIHLPLSRVEEFIPGDFHDNNWDDPIRMKHIDADTFGNSGEMDAERYSELLKSIREKGVTTPIQAFRLDNGEHLLENGHHRVVFARMAGLKTIPVEFTND